MISEMMDQPGRTFQAAYQLAFADSRCALNETAVRLAAGRRVERRLLRITLANYFAAALMMPYGKFHEAAELFGYDVEVLGAQFGASFEQVAHRLTTLGRPTARGIPFFMLRVDIAGNVSKRFSSGPFSLRPIRRHLPAVEYSCGLCRARPDFDAGDRTDGGSQWFSIARTVRRAITP